MTDICILIPAHNESQVIVSTLKAAGKLLPAEDIYIVDDGSTDATASLAAALTPNVLTVSNCGKATALNTAIAAFSLIEKYQYIAFLDADTQPQPDFLQKAMPHFYLPENRNIVCVVGQVKGLGSNWISRYRQWEYHVSHSIHKQAQAKIGSITVVPGCATIYKSSIFKDLIFPTGTLTEDMDFTFQLHRSGHNRMIFEPRAIVFVQDPQSLRDFIRQITRWYTGFWQVAKKHDIPWRGQTLDLEVTMLAIEGLYNGLIVVAFILSLLPLYFSHNLLILGIPLIIDLLFFFLPTLIWTSIMQKDFRYLLYLPHFYFLRFISSLVFLSGFFQGFLITPKQFTWHSRRYSL